MVTSNKLPDKKVVKMAEQNNSTVVPQRTLLGEVNEQITCPLCRGYYIDATTIVECLHSFCRSCIIKHLQISCYCPVCDVQINVAKPNFRLDKALQDIVYKLVPGLFQKEMERRQQFYSSRPGPAASATPEQRGEDTERIIFSPEDVISFSLEYADATDNDSISSKSSDSNEPQPPTGTTRRFLQCPAVVNISHLKKFLSMKFDIDSTQFAIDILYKRVPLPDYYTLMDIAYIYNWKRNEPMRFFYQIIDYVAIRNRLFDINRKGSDFRDRKSSPTPTEDTNVSSPAPNLNDQGSEISSGTDSPMPEENSGKKSHSSSTTDNNNQSNKDNSSSHKSGTNSNSTNKKNDDEVEKSQFLNSFELTAKSNSQSVKSSPVKGNSQETSASSTSETLKSQDAPKADDTLKRKPQSPPKAPEVKKPKIKLDKPKTPHTVTKPANSNLAPSPNSSESRKISGNVIDNLTKAKDPDNKHSPQPPKNTPPSPSTKEQKTTGGPKPTPESTGIKRTIPNTTNVSSPKRKAINEPVASVQSASQPKTVSPLKFQLPKMDSQQFPPPKPAEVPKPTPKRMPDLKPTAPPIQHSQNKGQPMNKVRMDLLANNSDPTIDRSKILSQVKSTLGVTHNHNAGQTSGDPLKSLLLDSCKINIPSSLSITLTDQKLDPRSPSDPNIADPKKNITNKNLVSANSGTAHKVPSPPVHNYIEILKLPDSNPKKQQMKPDGNTDAKQTPQAAKPESSTPSPKPTGKSSESSAKGPIPNLKPIADTKLGKQSGNFASPITFQQTFEKQLQSLASDKKTKLPKNKAQVPKLVPATPKTFNTMNKLNNPNNKSPSSVTMTPENKPSAALDLTTPHNMQSQVGQHPNQSRLLEKMQSIANLAATKQNPPGKILPANMSQGNVYSPMSNRSPNTPSPLRIPTSSMSQVKQDKSSPSGSQTPIRQDMGNKPFQMNQASSGNSLMSPSYQTQSHNSPTPAQPSPRSQTRSPSSSPKLVIAEEKQATSSSSEQNINQSNQISSTQIPNLNTLKNESPKASPGPSKPGPKPMKPISSGLKLSGIRQPITPTVKSNSGINLPPDFMASPQMIAQHPMMPHLRHQMEMNWYKANLFKSMANAVHQNQHDFNNKDKQ